MKKSKQVILILLGIIIAAAVVGGLLLNHFSFFKYADTPEIVSVEFVDQNPLSMKAFRSYIEEKQQYYESKNEKLDPSDYGFYINSFPVYHEFKVTLSDGRTVNVSSQHNIAQIDDATSVSVLALVKYGECLAVENNPSPMVPVTLTAILSTSKYADCTKEFEFQAQKPLIPSYLQSFTAHISEGKTYVVDSENFKFNEDTFDIVYADGTSKTVSAVKDEHFGSYSIDGHPVIVDSGVNTVDGQDYICYLDEKYPLPNGSFNLSDPSFTAKITSYTFNEKGLVDVVNFDITKEDGTVIPASVTVDKYGFETTTTYKNIDDFYPRVVVEYSGMFNPFAKNTVYITVADRYTALDTVILENPKGLSFFRSFDMSLEGAEFFAMLHGFVD